MACLPKKTPAARNTAEMPALARPRRSFPWYIASAAFKNQTAAPRYQIQLKLRLTFLWDAPPPTPATCLEDYDAYSCRHRRDGVCSSPEGERTRRRHPHLPCATIPVPVKAGGIGLRKSPAQECSFYAGRGSTIPVFRHACTARRSPSRLRSDATRDASRKSLRSRFLCRASLYPPSQYPPTN